MFSRFQGFYNSIKLIADWAVLALAFGLAYWTRFYSGLPHESIPPLEDTLTSLAMVLVVFPIAYRQANLYTTNRARSHIGEVFEIFKATVFATLLLVAIRYFTSERYSRMTIAIFMAYAFVGVSGVRLSFRAMFNALRRRGFNLKTILVVGAGELGQRVIETIVEHRGSSASPSAACSRASPRRSVPSSRARRCSGSWPTSTAYSSRPGPTRW